MNKKIHLVFITEDNDMIESAAQQWTFDNVRAAQLADTWLRNHYGNTRVLSKIIYDEERGSYGNRKDV